ncbi:MAG: hypothetical protein IK142_06755 [Clostridiales bacterium]|nr:hypothetical protein [Clostridiales bacterium]
MKKRKVLAAALCAVMLAGCQAAPAETSSATTEATAGTTAEVTETEQTESQVQEAEETEPAETTEAFVLGDDGFLPEYETFELTSEDLVDGVWNPVISSENVSPELSWEPVEGADSYVIYMVDVTAYFFIHWKADAVTETDLPQGWATGATYVGPYPPSGVTHTYDVYVMALRGDVDRVRGTVNATNQNFASFIRGLDTDVDGNSGNIISYGYLSGEYTAP